MKGRHRKQKKQQQKKEYVEQSLNKYYGFANMIVSPEQPLWPM